MLRKSELVQLFAKTWKKCDLTLFSSRAMNSVMHGTSDASEVSLEREKVAYYELYTYDPSVLLPLEKIIL